MKNIEIEIKVPLDIEAFRRCRTFLDSEAHFVAENEQTDQYFTPSHRDFLAPDFPFEWLSIRQRGGKSNLNYKHWYPENALESTHCDEYEIQVSDADALQLLLRALDVKSLVTVKKIRRIYDLENTFEIALDEIADLGYFIEIEFKGSGTIENANIEIRKLASLLGIQPEKRDHRGYPYLMLEKAGLLGGSR